MEDLVADRKAVVKIVNRLRKLYGKGSTSRLGRGVRQSAHANPVAMSFQGLPILGVWHDRKRGGINWNVVFKPTGDLAFPLTKAITAEEEVLLARFLDNFDAGRYPELEIPMSEVKINGQVVA